MSRVSVDFETYGTVELRRSGVYPYAAHSDTDLWLMGYAFDDEEPEVWLPGQPFPERLRTHIAAGGEMRAWNAQFERVVWRDLATPRYGFPPVALEQWFDSMAEAAAMGLPRALEKAARVLGVDQQKDVKGHRLMLKMARPRRWDEAAQRFVWWNSADHIAALASYNKQDVRTERAAAKMLRRLTDRERALYLLDQRINDRGVYLDRKLAVAAQRAAVSELERQNVLLAEATGGAVVETTKVAKLKEWLAGQGVEAASLDKAAIRELLAPEGAQLSPAVRAALTARSAAAKSSVAKIDAMFHAAGTDGYMRGLLRYHAAHTGRWGGALVQPQNFPRGLDLEEKPEAYIERVMAGERVSLAVISGLLRSMLTAPPGYDLMAGDFAAIEARALAWVAGQESQLALYRQGVSPYPPMGAVIFKRPAPEIIKPSTEYVVAKNTVLGAGFQMGWEQFRSQLKEQAGVEVSEELAREAIAAYRELNRHIVRYWGEVNFSALDAVRNPGVVYSTPEGLPRVRLVVRGGYLWIVLPSGRSLAYAKPKIVDRATPWGAIKAAVEYSGMNSFTKRWERVALYGGMITENIVQGVARDLLADAMLRVDPIWPVVLTVHDEIVVQAPEESDPRALFTEIMRRVEPWAAGLPVDVEVWKGHRYRK